MFKLIKNYTNDNFLFPLSSFLFPLKAFTLAEIVIVFMVIAIIATATMELTKARINSHLNKFGYYSAFTNLKQGVAEILAEGCTSADVTSGYCESTSSLPSVASTADSRGLCDRISNLFNKVGSANCSLTADDSTGFLNADTNFITINGMRFFNFGSDSVNNIYTIYIDIDALKRKSLLNTDVMKYTINTNGTVLPAVDSEGGNNTEYLSASVRYRNASGQYVWVLTDATYREAACTSNKVTDAIYCSGYSASPTCSGGTYDCELVINKPGFFLFSQ